MPDSYVWQSAIPLPTLRALRQCCQQCSQANDESTTHQSPPVHPSVIIVIHYCTNSFAMWANTAIFKTQNWECAESEKVDPWVLWYPPLPVRRSRFRSLHLLLLPTREPLKAGNKRASVAERASGLHHDTHTYIVGRTELASEEKWIPNYGHQPAVGWCKSIENIACNIYLIRFRDCVRSRSPFFPRDWCTQVRDPIFHRIHRDGANWVWAVMVEVFCFFMFLLKF